MIDPRDLVLGPGRVADYSSGRPPFVIEVIHGDIHLPGGRQVAFYRAQFVRGGAEELVRLEMWTGDYFTGGDPCAQFCTDVELHPRRRAARISEQSERERLHCGTCTLRGREIMGTPEAEAVFALGDAVLMHDRRLAETCAP